MSSFVEQQDMINSQIEGIGSDIVSVNLEIKKVEAKTNAIEVQIDAIDARLVAIATEILITPEEAGLSGLREEKARLHVDKAQLRTKEEQLRTEEEQLRTKEEQLRTKEEQLRTKEEQLRTKEEQLRTKEEQLRKNPTGDQRVSLRIIPTPQEVASETRVLACMGEKATLAARAEDETFGVRSVLDEVVRDFSSLVSSGSSMSKYGSLGAGISTNASVPDFVWLVKSRVFGILEAKDGAASTIVALRQAAITAMAIVSDLRSLNLPPKQIVIPVAGCTGSMIQFGAVICLDHSFGTFLATSTILDLSDMSQNLLAVAYLRKASVCALETERLLDALEIPQGDGNPPEQVFAMSLDSSKYWIKYLKDDVFARGLGLFTSSTSSRLDVGPGLEHMGRALTLLYQCPAVREFVVFPLSVRSPNQLDSLVPEFEANNCYMIIYDDMSELGYRMGTPNRLVNEKLYQNFLLALRDAVGKVHSAGVLHCDLYPSNIMWRCDADADSGAVAGLSIKIIDWDCAHCLAEGDFSPRIKEALAMHRPTRSANFGVQHDLDYLQALEAQRGPGDGRDEVWQALASNEKKQVDRAFYRLFTDTSV